MRADVAPADRPGAALPFLAADDDARGGSATTSFLRSTGAEGAAVDLGGEVETTGPKTSCGDEGTTLRGEGGARAFPAAAAVFDLPRPGAGALLLVLATGEEGSTRAGSRSAPEREGEREVEPSERRDLVLRAVCGGKRVSVAVLSCTKGGGGR